MNKIKHTKSIDLKTVSSSEFLITSYRCIKKLGWEISYINDNGIIAKTPASINNWSEEVSLRIDGNKALIKSECIENEVFDWGKNRKNIHQFILQLKKLSKTISPPEIFEAYQELSENFSSEKKDISIEIDKKSLLSLSRIARLFTPRNDYQMTPVLIYINVLVFLFMVSKGVSYLSPGTIELFNFGGGFKPVILNGEWWRLISMIFIHAGLFHLLGNIVTLIFIGLLLEPYLGSKKFLTLYLIVGLAASTISLWLNTELVAVGASGAIFGMYGVFIALLTTKHLKKTFTKSFIISFSAFILYNLLNGILVPGIDNAAHFGGIISGFLIGYMIIPSIKNFNNIRITNLNLAAVSIVFILFTTIVYYSLPNNYTAEQRNPQFYINQYENYHITINDNETENVESDYSYSEEEKDNVLFKRLNEPTTLEFLSDNLESKSRNLIYKYEDYENEESMEIYSRFIKSIDNMEKMALEVNKMSSPSHKEEILKELKTRSRYYWNENLNLLDSLKKLDLPNEIENHNLLLEEYYTYRLKATKLRIKTIEEDTDKYKEEYNDYQEEINKMLDEIYN